MRAAVRSDEYFVCVVVSWRMKNGPDFIINLKTLPVCLFTLNICLGDVFFVFNFPQAADRNLMIQTQVLVNKDVTGNGPPSHFVQFYSLRFVENSL